MFIHICFKFFFAAASVKSEEITYKDSEGKRVYEVVPHTKTKAGLRKVMLPEAASLLLKELFTFYGENEFVFVNQNHRIKGLEPSHYIF